MNASIIAKLATTARSGVACAQRYGYVRQVHRIALLTPLLLLGSCRHWYLPICTGGTATPLAVEAPPQNVVMISIDTLRRDRVGRYDGSDRTPTLDAVLAAGVTLDDHQSCSNWTYASLLCALGGRYNAEAGIAPESDDLDTDPLPQGVRLLGEVLRDQGFHTRLVSANHFLSARFSFDRSYDRIVNDTEWSATELVDTAVAEATALAGRDEPWMLHLHFLDPHLPYEAPGVFGADVSDLAPIDWDVTTKTGLAAVTERWEGLGDDEQALIRAHLDRHYDSQLNYLDHQLGRLMGELTTLGVLDDSLVVIWSDHGEQLWDHGQVAHRKALYSEETGAIASFLAPGLEPVAWDEPTSHVDLAPSVLELMHLSVPKGMTGAPLGSRSADCPRFADCFAGDATQQSVDQDGWRLIYRWSGQRELYDLRADPQELNDLWVDGHEVGEELWQALEPHVAVSAPLHDKATPL